MREHIVCLLSWKFIACVQKDCYLYFAIYLLQKSIKNLKNNIDFKVRKERNEEWFNNWFAVVRR